MRTVLVEAEGQGVDDALSEVTGVEGIASSETRNGRTRVTLTVGSGADPRAEIFELAKSRDWVLWELHEEHASLEDLFSQLTR